MEELRISEALKCIYDCNVGVGDIEYMQLARTCGSDWVTGSVRSQASNYVKHVRRARGNRGVSQAAKSPGRTVDAMLVPAWRTKRGDGELLLPGFGAYWH